MAPRPQLLAYPFRVLPSGRAALVDQDSEEAAVQQLAVLAMTRRGERALATEVGITDPAFGGFQPAEFVAQAARWGPKVALERITAEPAPGGSVRVTVAFR